MAAELTRGTPITYAVMIFPGFPMMAFSAVVEPLRAANLLKGEICFTWAAVGLTDAPVPASNGFAITPDFSVEKAPVSHRVVLCTGGDAERLEVPEVGRWLRRCLHGGAEVGAVADGAFLLAREGLLSGYRCAIHWTARPALAERFPEVDTTPDLFVVDRTRFTAAGGIGSFDMMLELIARDQGPGLAAQVAEWFLHSPLRQAVDRRLMPLRLRTGIRDELVLSALALMEEGMEAAEGISLVAERLGVSQDRLERAFQAETGEGPGRYFRRMRLRHARDLLAHSSLSVEEVALACGYAGAPSFARAFRAEFGHSPRTPTGSKLR
jgi:transcriptional regulator GlxA family with amidase domain